MLFRSLSLVAKSSSKVTLVTAVVAWGAIAQCAPRWLTGAMVGTDGTVRATTMWDPDGAGPRPAVLVVAGDFIAAGTVAANRIVTYDLATGAWSALGSGMDGPVHAVLALPNGELVAGGDFTRAGGVSANRIARWNGTGWVALGSGMNLTVEALASLPNGDIVAGGRFFTAGGQNADRVASWDGASWSPLGSGVDWRVSALVTLPNGDLVAGGEFATAGGVSAARVARWNGTTWSPLGPGPGHNVCALLVLPNGDLIAGGWSGAMGGGDSIARWNGTGWSALGSGIYNGRVYALTALPNGDLVVGGVFSSVGSVAARCVARWDGAAWSALGAGPTTNPVLSLCTLPNGDVIAGAEATFVSGADSDFLLRWNGTAWAPFGSWSGPNGPVFATATMPNGDLVVGGQFSIAGSVTTQAIARWDGVAWSSLGAGLFASYPGVPRVEALAVLPNGDLIAGGEFSVAGGVSARRIARWDGFSWSALGGGLSYSPLAITVLPNGELLVGCYGYTVFGGSQCEIMRWDGVQWHPFGSAGLSSAQYTARISAFLVLPNGDLIVGGAFNSMGWTAVNHVARFSANGWTAMGSGMSAAVYPGARVNALLALPNGDVVAGGVFTQAGGVNVSHVARWDGVAWSSLGPGVQGISVTSLASLANGDLVAAGEAAVVAGMMQNQIVRWDGAAWSVLGAGVVAPYGTSGTIHTIAVQPGGSVAYGGRFTVLQGSAAPFLAQLVPTCPALAVPAGVGCAGAGSVPLLQATALPWLGAICQTRGTGLPTNALVAGVAGLVPWSLPLTAVFSQALPGCVLHTTPDAVLVGQAMNGRFDTSFSVPAAPVLVGLPLFQQLILQEIGSQQQLLTMTATNALRLTAGMF